MNRFAPFVIMDRIALELVNALLPPEVWKNRHILSNVRNIKTRKSLWVPSPEGAEAGDEKTVDFGLSPKGCPGQKAGRKAALSVVISSVTGVSFHPDKSRLASRSRDGHVKVWDWKAESELLTLPLP